MEAEFDPTLYNRTDVLAAVQQNGNALFHACPTLKSDPEIVLALDKMTPAMQGLYTFKLLFNNYNAGLQTKTGTFVLLR